MKTQFYTDKRSMLCGQTIVIQALSRFDAVIQSTSYAIGRELAKNNQVFFVDKPFTVNEFFKLRKTNAWKLRKPLFSWFSKGLIPSDDENFKIIVTPVILSLHFIPEGKIYRQLLKINEWIIAKRIQKVIVNQKVNDYIFINSADYHFPGLQKRLNAILNVYHCVDPVITVFDKRHGQVSEPLLIKETDVVICTSNQLQNEKRRLNSNTYFIPNAANIDHSIKATDLSLPVHHYLSKLKKPIIGYLGSIERRMDYVLLKEVILNHPDKDFVFVGPVISACVPDWFYQQPNLHVFEPIDYDEIPALIKGFAVAIIPFKKDVVSRSIFPLKLFEYLGAGKPVVAINFNPDLQDFTKGTVVFCDNAKEFSNAVNQELGSDSPQKIKNRLAVASENTWIKRAEDVSALLAEQIKNH